MNLGLIGFLSPWILAGLVVLPIIWWLLRFTPPRPRQIWFPPTRLLLDLDSEEQTPVHSPWWLTALRILLAALIIFALAQPVLNPDRTNLNGNGPILIVVDNGWASAPVWNERVEVMSNLIDQAERLSRTVIIANTAATGSPLDLTPLSPKKAEERAASLLPQPFDPDRQAVIEKLEAEISGQEEMAVFWLNDGLDYGQADAFAERLGQLNDGQVNLTLFRDANPKSLGLNLENNASDAMVVRVIRAGEGSVSGRVMAKSTRGALLGDAEFALSGSAKEVSVELDLPLEIRNQVAELQIVSENSAGAVHLLDSRTQRRRVGLISGESRELAQPLLSPIYYVERAIAPFSELATARESNIATSVTTILSQNPSVIILANIGKLVGQSEQGLTKWVNDGGVLLRFAGPRLERDSDELLPVKLRKGGRVLGGALSWSTPQSLSPFENSSLFYGLDVSEDVLINRQVLADPLNTTADSQIWARLNDGTPLVTARQTGKGWVVLFHVTANSDWSNLPLSGLFVSMLRRIVDFSANLDSPVSGTGDGSPANQSETGTQNSGPLINQAQLLAPTQTLDGYGKLVSPPSTVEPIDKSKLAELKPSLKHPPGIYGPQGSVRSLNVITRDTNLTAFRSSPSGMPVVAYERSESLSLKPWLLFAALALFFLDAIIMLVMSGGFRRASPSGAYSISAILLLLTTLGFVSWGNVPVQAQNEDKDRTAFALEAALDTRLAYIVTGDEGTDRMSRQGLLGLSRVLRARTAIEPAEPIGINVDVDELAFFPVLYWPVRADAERLTESTLAKVDAYMKQGGMIIFDTKDFQQQLPLGVAGEQSPGTTALQRIIGGLDIPRLEPVPEGHVLTKSFYLLSSFPGRWDGGALWVEAQPVSTGENQERSTSRTDGVSSILITSNDLAAAWALDEQNQPLYPTVPGGENQREMSFRTGVNIVMYALTGNYKADQVHIPALLERLGQ